MSKRVSGQYHLSLHQQPTYKGLPILNCKDGFVEEYLERLLCTINRSLQCHSKVFAARVDLHFPQYHFPEGQEIFSNEYLHLFIKALRRKLQRYKTEKQGAGQRVHSLGFEYVWTREYGPSSDKPHFHLLLLFSGHAFNSLGHFSNAHESLYNRIGESWGEALGVHVVEGNKFTHFPEIGQYLVDSRNADQMAQVFCRASYLAKVVSKNFHDGFHVFGGSRE
ncbi:inovirus Gp2 family protein [Cellvibrio mixtus]|uniref:inovirus Gp2 family protein n=1 Tax=Cellvibrio mixtus TaxID=39650 RepID=UPI000586BC92|nr:inovirus Gp2 family protein [Cellvibrio mixtus]